MSFNKLKIDYLSFVVSFRGGSFSFILLVKLLNYKSAAECFFSNLFIRGCFTQLRVWVCVSVSVRWYWRASARGPRFLLLRGRRGFSIYRQLSLLLYNSKCLRCRCWTWQFYSSIVIPAWLWFRWQKVWVLRSGLKCVFRWLLGPRLQLRYPAANRPIGWFETQRQCWLNLPFPEKRWAEFFRIKGDGRKRLI